MTELRTAILVAARTFFWAVTHPTVYVVIDDASFEEQQAELRKRLGRRRGYKYVRTSWLARKLYGSLYYGPPQPSAPGRVCLFQTTDFHVWEQGPDGLIFRDGRRVAATAPAAFSARLYAVGELLEGTEAGFAFDDGKGDFTLVATEPGEEVLFLLAQPRVREEGESEEAATFLWVSFSV